MKQKLEAVIRHIVDDKDLTEINIPEQFCSSEDERTGSAKKMNAAFLILLSGESHPLHSQAVQYLHELKSDPALLPMVEFYLEGITRIHSEILLLCSEDAEFQKNLNSLCSWTVNPENRGNRQETVEKIRSVFFPEGAGLCERRVEKINELRSRRTIKITKLNPAPIKNPAKEILFTSNILVTIPPASKEIQDLPLDEKLKEKLKGIVQEKQLYWYDHPIPVGIPQENNEAVYGLDHLDRAIEFEKLRGSIDKNTKVICALSVSVTHKGLQKIAKEYLEAELKNKKNLRHLDVYVFTEEDTKQLVENIFVPAVEKYKNCIEHGLLYKTIGVDGEYGRHYSFLKAVSALWKVVVDSDIKGTFKIDLDQVFPQRELAEHSGLSAFEHFKTPLWGADGTDSEGNPVELGMIAGALVNQRDIDDSLFIPDVCFPGDSMRGDQLVFFSALPQALSTESEMMTRYGDDVLDGEKKCIQRIHVTGGTCGILVNSLRKYRPFTPTFIGRAEDQAYILSVLFDGPQKKLRYLHKDGLIMRHDKEAFAGEAIIMAATGKLIGDYIRTLMFSFYARALPWPLEDIKNIADPFTGCFISKIPFTIVYLRFALKAALLFVDTGSERNKQGLEFLQNGIPRLQKTMLELSEEPNPLISQFREEKYGWDLFYDTLDEIEGGLKKGDAFALKLQEKARSLIDGCRINFNKDK
jgi:hypothetical protein